MRHQPYALFQTVQLRGFPDQTQHLLQQRLLQADCRDFAVQDLPFYEYQEFYDKIKDDGTTETVSLIPENTVLFAPKGNMVKFAAESSITDGILQGDLIPRIYEDEKNDSVELRTVSKPVLIPLNTKSLRILQVK